MAKKRPNKRKMRAIQANPGYERWVENMDEFGRAGKANKWFRAAFKPILNLVADRYVSGRLTKVMSKIVQSDRVNERGKRTVHNGELRLLEHFNFNRDARLFDAINLPGYEITYSRETGRVQLHIPSIQPWTYVNMPEKTSTCFSILAAAAAIDFDADRQVGFDDHITEKISIGTEWIPSMQLALTLTAGITSPVFIALGIQFFELHRSGKYSMTDKKFNAMEIVKVFTEQVQR